MSILWSLITLLKLSRDSSVVPSTVTGLVSGRASSEPVGRGREGIAWMSWIALMSSNDMARKTQVWKLWQAERFRILPLGSSGCAAMTDIRCRAGALTDFGFGLILCPSAGVSVTVSGIAARIVYVSEPLGPRTVGWADTVFLGLILGTPLVFCSL